MSCLKLKLRWAGGWDQLPGVVERLPHALGLADTRGRGQAVGVNPIQNSQELVSSPKERGPSLL